MGRRAKRTGEVEGKPARKSPKTDDAQVHDLETRVENGARVSTPCLPLAHSSVKEDA